MVQERLGNAVGLWNFPGGDDQTIEGRRETPAEAAIREVREEVGLEIEVASHLLSQEVGEAMMWHAFLGKVVGGKLSFQDEELIGGGFLSPDQVQSMGENLRDPALMLNVLQIAQSVAV